MSCRYCTRKEKKKISLETHHRPPPKENHKDSSNVIVKGCMTTLKKVNASLEQRPRK